MFYSLSLSKKINLILIVVALLTLSSTMVFFYVDEKSLAESFVEKNLESMATNYFDSINTMMLTGTMANRKIFQNKLLSQDDIIEARIIRGPKIVEFFGKGFEDQISKSSIDEQGLAGKKTFNIYEKDGKRMMEFVMPLIAKEDYRGTNCLSCHQAKENDVLGAVKMTYDLSTVDSSIMKSIIHASIIQLLITIIGFGVLIFVINKLVFYRLKRLRRTINDVEQNLDLKKEIKVYYDDELGAVSFALNNMIKTFKNSFVAVSNATEKLTSSAKDVDEISSLTMEAVLQQKNGTDSVAAAINELDASANEVKVNTESAAAKSVSANEKASQGLELVVLAKEGINSLRDQVIDNTAKIVEVSEKTNEVGSVLEVITAIAEQTNLLALNAAIEAARAGEQGRGFAVVADEVRSLATRTRDSIDEIQKTISFLQEDVKVAVDSMTSASEQANEKAEDVSNVAELLVEITTQIKELDELNCEVALAAQQQNLAADEININIVSISDVAEKSSDDAIRGKQVSEHLLELSDELNQQLSKFKL